MRSIVSNLLIAGGLLAGTAIVAQGDVLDIWTAEEGSYYQDADFANGVLQISAQERTIGSDSETVLDLRIAVEREVGSSTETDYFVGYTKQGEPLPVRSDVYPANEDYEQTSEDAEGSVEIDSGNRASIGGILLDQEFSADVVEGEEQ